MAGRLAQYLSRSGRTTRTNGVKISRRLYSSSDKQSEVEHGEQKPTGVEEYRSPWYILKKEFQTTKEGKSNKLPIPRETDIAVIGGGAIGSSVAYWLKQKNPVGFNLAVIEQDPCYTRAATVLSVGGLRQQFSLKENIEMSLFTADFIRNIREHLSIYGKDPPNIQFNPQGYLFMSTEAGADQLEANHRLQVELGAKVVLYNQRELKERFPWMNVEGIALASYGLENEGWFDPWLLLQALRNKASSLGGEYYKGQVVGFRFRDVRLAGQEGTVKIRKTLDQVEVKADDGQVYPMRFAACINCAGPWSREVARMAGIGGGEGPLSFNLPVEPRKRYVFVFHCPDGPGLDTPMIIDPTGVYVRREGLGGLYVCGASPTPETCDNGTLAVESGYFEEYILPILKHRVKGFEKLQLRSAWAGYYDYNYLDENLIIGNHPHHLNMFMATGCSGHGIQQAPAIGRAMMEILLDNEYSTIDLSRFSFDRVLDDEPIFESNIV